MLTRLLIYLCFVDQNTILVFYKVFRVKKIQQQNAIYACIKILHIKFPD